MTAMAKTEGKGSVGRRQTYEWRCLSRFFGQDPMSGCPIEEEASNATILQGNREQGAESRARGRECTKRGTSLVFLQGWHGQREGSRAVIYGRWLPWLVKFLLGAKASHLEGKSWGRNRHAPM